MARRADRGGRASGGARAAPEPSRSSSFAVEERRKAMLEERNRLARDIHDNLAQGFAAILMQLQGAQREAPACCRRRSRRARDRRRSGPHAPDGSAAVGRRPASERRAGRGHRDRAEAAGRPGTADGQACRSISSSTNCRASATPSNAKSSASRRRRSPTPSAIPARGGSRSARRPFNRSDCGSRSPTMAAASRAISRRPDSA